MHHIIYGKSEEIIACLPNNFIDLIITSPPYNVGKDYGIYKDNLSDIEYMEWVKTFLLEINRICKSICVFVPQKYKREYWWILGPGYKEIILSYGPVGAIRWGFINQFSSLLTNAVPIRKVKNVWHNCQMPGLGYFFRENNYGHPGYTSEDITRRVISAFILPEQSVLDIFLGTVTTGVICMQLNRKFIGCEIEPKYFEIAKTRIKYASAQTLLPGIN